MQEQTQVEKIPNSREGDVSPSELRTVTLGSAAISNLTREGSFLHGRTLFPQSVFVTNEFAGDEAVQTIAEGIINQILEQSNNEFDIRVAEIPTPNGKFLIVHTDQPSEELEGMVREAVMSFAKSFQEIAAKHQ